MSGQHLKCANLVCIQFFFLVHRGTLSGCYATTLGAALHEIGHIFDLVHTDFGVMARGFEELDLFFTVGNPQPKHYYTGMLFFTRENKPF